jgi:hypothetical protein
VAYAWGTGPYYSVQRLSFRLPVPIFRVFNILILDWHMLAGNNKVLANGGALA